MVSIVILNCNGKEFLEKCMPSVIEAANVYGKNCEIMAVDNGSIDGSINYLKSKFPEARIIALEKNFDFAKGMNIGFREAKGDIVIGLNNDVIVEEGFIAPLVSHFNGNGSIFAVAAKMLLWDRKTLNFGRAVGRFRFGIFRRRFQEPARPTNTLYACGGAFAVDRNKFLELGGFDEDMIVYWEDLDLCYRAWKQGYKTIYEPRSVVYHKFHGTYAKKCGQNGINLLSGENYFLFALKNFHAKGLFYKQLFSFPLLLIAAPLIGKAHFAIGLLRSLKRWPLFLKKRREERQKAIFSDREVLCMSSKVDTSDGIYRRVKFKELINKKILGICLSLGSLCGGRSFWRPRLIGIEPTNRCNLNCIMCARRYWDKENNKLGNMSIELFRDKILPFLMPKQIVNLQCLGEPLLGEYFFEMLSECKKKGCRVSFTTNGTLLKRYAQRLIELQTDSIRVSIDGIRSFKNIRNIEIDSIIEGIQEINLMKRKLNSNYPVIDVEFVAMEQNIRELPELVDLAYKLKIKCIYVVHAVIHSKQLINQSLFIHTKIAEKYFREAYRKSKKLGVQISLPPLKDTIQFCYQPFAIMYINWNGDVRPCCSATINENDTLKLGNLKDSSLPELWNSLMMRNLRRSLSKNTKLAEFCKKCVIRVYSQESHTRILKNGWEDR